MRITKEEAERIAHEYVRTRKVEPDVELVLLTEKTIERSFGWVFFYDSKRYVQTGEFRDAVLGNAPIVVTKHDGRVHETGTAHPVEHYLQKFGG